MKLLYISTEPVPGAVGGSVRTMEVAEQLARRGHAVTVLTHRSSGQKRKELIGRVAVARENMRLPKTVPLLALRRLSLLRERFDAVIERYSVFGGLGTLVSKRYGTPLVLEINAPHIEEAGLGPLGALARRWQTVQYRQAAFIMASVPSLVPKPFRHKARIYQLGGVNTEMFRPRGAARRIRKRYGLEGKFVFCYHGAFTRWHGVLDLVDAIPQVVRRNKNVRFLFVGSGELEQASQKRAAANGAAAYSTFVGRVPYAAMPRYLAACDAGVAPYNIGGFPHLKRVGFYWSPLKVFEYLAAGLPVVAADYPELRAIVNGCGIRFTPGNVRKLADALAKLARAAGYARLKSKCRAQAARFSWKENARILDKILHEAVTR